MSATATQRQLTPRADTRAEQAVIGSMMIEPAAIRVARQWLTPAAFFDSRHRLIFEVISAMNERAIAADLVTVSDEMRTLGHLDVIGGLAYLSECTHAVATAANVEHYAKIVARLDLERQMLHACRALAQDPAADQLEAVRALVLRRETLFAHPLLSYGHDLVGVLDDLMGQKAGKLYKTGFPGVDRAWSGCRAGEINTWAAATNDGKSVLLLNLMHLAAAAGTHCLYVGTEMSAAETVHRHLSVASGIEAWKLRQANLKREEVQQLQDTLGDRLAKMPITILDHPEPTLREIETAIMSSKAEIVFLDYLERFNLPPAENLRLRIKEFMRSLKSMSRRCGVVVHLASQLNRSAYGKSSDSAPTMAEISESSAVEKESDRVMLMWAPKDKQAGMWSKRRLEVIQAKNRHGPRGIKFELELDEKVLTVTDATGASPL